MENIRFRSASTDDIPRILEIILQAQRRMAAAGSLQWQDGYPALRDIAADVARACGYVICRTGTTAGKEPGKTTDAGEDRPEVQATLCGNPSRNQGTTAPESLPPTNAPMPGSQPPETIVTYGAILFDGEPTYAEIRGEWLSASRYVVVHRLAVADEALGHGLGTEFLRQAARLARERGIPAFRIDTNFDNRRMLRILARNGFVRCGTIRCRSGEREAFEKRLLSEE